MIKLLPHKLFSSICVNGFYAFLIATIFFSFSSHAQVSASFSATPVRGCAPLVVSFTDHSTGSPTTWSWDLGNGVHSTSPSPATSYTLSGVYTVTLTASNGTSSNTIIQTNYITVYANPTAGFTLN